MQNKVPPKKLFKEKNCSDIGYALFLDNPLGKLTDWVDFSMLFTLPESLRTSVPELSWDYGSRLQLHFRCFSSEALQPLQRWGQVYGEVLFSPFFRQLHAA